MSCGREALCQLGFEDDEVRYFACEIDKPAMQVAQANFPDTVQLGDVRKVQYIPDVKDRSQSFLVDDKGNKHIVGKIDLFIGGSPCQGISANGPRSLMQHDQSVLFQRFTALLDDCEPRYWLLENVKNPTFESFATRKLKKFGAKLFKLDSKYWAAARRLRNYWTNIPYDETKPPTPSTIGSPLTMQEVIGADYSGLWRKLQSRHDPVKCKGFYPNEEKMFTCCKDVRGYFFPIRTADLVNLPKFKADPKHTHPELTKFTRTELEQMATLPVGYTNASSEAQAGIMIGNGWTVAVICDLFRAMFDAPAPTATATAVPLPASAGEQYLCTRYRLSLVCAVRMQVRKWHSW